MFSKYNEYNVHFLYFYYKSMTQFHAEPSQSDFTTQPRRPRHPNATSDSSPVPRSHSRPSPRKFTIHAWFPFCPVHTRIHEYGATAPDSFVPSWAGSFGFRGLPPVWKGTYLQHLRSTAEAATKSPIFTTIYHKQLVSFTGGVNPSLREEVLALEGASENLDPSDRSIGPDIVIWILVICL